MAPSLPNILPGVSGKDYHFVSYGGKTYVVYAVTLANGKQLQVSWLVNPADFAGLGIDATKVNHISKTQFDNLNFLGNSSQILKGETGAHPFDTYIKSLQHDYRGVSWLSDQQFVMTMLEGYAEGWTSAQLQQQLSQTKWYQSRTDYQRQWELTMSKGDRKAAITDMKTQVSDALRELYGANFDLASAGITQKNIAAWAEQIASGDFGAPTDGFQSWFSEQQQKAEAVDGTPAWISYQQGLQAQNEFLNKPEDMFQQIKTESSYWLGPQGVPSDETLKKWATDLVAGTSSQADWQQFLQKQAQAKYPYLGANTPWQEFADPYKRMVETDWGMPIDWSNPILQNLGGTDGSTPMSFHDFEVQLRSDPQFWNGPVAAQEGYSLLNQLNSIFRGVG